VDASPVRSTSDYTRYLAGPSATWRGSLPGTPRWRFSTPTTALDALQESEILERAMDSIGGKAPTRSCSRSRQGGTRYQPPEVVIR